MAAWPRTVDCAKATPMSLPEALKSWGESGRGQFRALYATGWVWTEEYPPFDMGSISGRAMWATIQWYLYSKTVFDIDPPANRTRLGAGGGTPLVNGASQSGYTIAFDGFPNSTTVMRAGDVFRIGGTNILRMAQADVVSNGSGQASVTFIPPIPVGASPADNAAMTYVAPVTLKAVVDVIEVGEIQSTEYIQGVRVTFREQPS